MSKKPKSKSFFKKLMLLPIALTMLGGGAKASLTGAHEEDAKLAKRHSIKRKASRTQLAVDELSEQARDVKFLQTLMTQLDPKDSAAARHFGIQFLQTYGINGRGASVIVYDGAFEKDATTHFIEFNDVFGPGKEKDIEHGNRVAAALASTNAKSLGVAAGATVLPVKWDGVFDTPINPNTLVVLEERGVTYPWLHNEVPKPRVINMSLSFLADARDDKTIGRLITLLNKNDMLLVVSAGNEGAKGDEEKLKGRPHAKSIREEINAYPELAKRVLIVGSFDHEDKNKLSKYSNPARDQKDHYIVSEGFHLHTSIVDPTTGITKSDDESVAVGTSFASPQVAGLAVLIGKYFPKLSMLEIKDIILKSAFKIPGQDAEIVGHGAFNPLNAWIMALEASPFASPQPVVDEDLKIRQEALQLQEAELQRQREASQAQLAQLEAQQAEMRQLEAQLAELRALNAQAVQPPPAKQGFLAKFFSRFKK